MHLSLTAGTDLRDLNLLLSCLLSDTLLVLVVSVIISVSIIIIIIIISVTKEHRRKEETG